MELNELPGSELILPGLEDLHQGRNATIGSLLIAIASVRLTEAGLEIPKAPLASEPELLLYATCKPSAKMLILTTMPYSIASIAFVVPLK